MPRGAAEREQIEFLPAIDGAGVDIVFRHTSKMTSAELSSLVEYTYAWATEAGVKFPAHIDPETGEIT